MKKFLKAIPAVIALTVLFMVVNPVRSDVQSIDPASYPMIGDEEMGQLRWIAAIADQPINEFANMKANNQYGMSSYRYCTAFMTYFLATEQYHKLPACPEIIQSRMDRFIRKMVTKPVWEFWAIVSQGVPPFEPDFDKPYPEEHDPVGNRNIMYSGHLGHMIGLYEMLYGDLKWSEPGSMVFEWSETEKYTYNNHSLQKVMFDQLMNSADKCIECEPNACFPECNQHPILSFMLYDHVHGKNLARARKPFMEFFLKNKMIDPRNHHAAAFYLVKQKKTVSHTSPGFGNRVSLLTIPGVILHAINIKNSSANGWTGTFMHAWQPEYIKRHYPYQLERHLIKQSDGKVRLRKDFFSTSTQVGFFAMLVSEMGDREILDKLFDHAANLYGPVQENGTFHYPYNMKRNCTNLTGKLIACARANPGNGMWNMHNKPFDKVHFKEPKVVGVDFPKVLLRRAVFDNQKQALVITTEPGTDQRGATSIKVVQLDPARTWRLLIDGREVKKYNGTRSISIEVPLDARHDIVLVAE